MSFEIIRNATREVLGEADTLAVAIDRARDFARPSAEVVVRDPDGELVATVWHDGMVEAW